MANPNPTKARQARAKKKLLTRAGNLSHARLALWRAIKATEDILATIPSNPEMTLKATHALTQSCSAYIRLVEAAELESRIAALEEELNSR